MPTTAPARTCGAVAHHTRYLKLLWRPDLHHRGNWHIPWGQPGFNVRIPPAPTTGHQPTLIRCDWNRPDPTRPLSTETWVFRWRGACLGCTWEGPDWRCHDEAVEDAHDHTHPQWRTLQVMPPCPGSGAAMWAKHLRALYPPGWFERGGPLRVWRPQTTRHEPGGASGGRYLLAEVRRQDDQSDLQQLALL